MRTALLIALLALAPGLPALAGDAPSAAGGDAPAATAADDEPQFVDLSGTTVRVSDHRGEIVVLNFWATWCGPCRAELPELGKAREEWQPKGVTFIAAAANGRDEGAAVTALLDQLGVKLDAWLWVTAKDMRHWGVGPGIPATLVLDREGAIRATFRGAVTREQLRPIVTELIAAAQKAAK